MKPTFLTRVIGYFVAHIGNPFRLDLRSLAFYRVVIGLVLLLDIVQRWTDLTVFYTEQGIISSDVGAQAYETFSYSFHGAVDSNWWVIGLFALQSLFAIGLIIGYRTRTMMILSFVFLVSLQNRNSIILNGGDVLLRVQLFWSIFLPMNRHFSLDLAQNRVARAIKQTAFSPATIAIVVQTALLFWQTSTFKTGAAWRENYEALYITLNAEAFSAPWGTWLSQFRTPMRMLTWMAIMVEDLAPILVMMPFFNKFARMLALILVIGLYGGILTTMSVGVFPLIGIATLLVLVPGSFWDALSGFVHRTRQMKPLVVYYDTSCGICVTFLRLLSAFALTKNVTVQNVYDNKTTTSLSNKHNSWVGRIGRKYMFKADVFIAILDRSVIWWVVAPLLRTKPIHAIATRIYNYVSSHRHSICKPPKPQTWLQKRMNNLDSVFVFAGQAVVMVLLISTIVWVRSDIPNPNSLRVSGIYYDTMRMIRLDQYWNMFSPSPLSYNSWPVIEGITGDGSVDVWRPYWDDDSAEVSFEKPDHSYPLHVNPRWRRVITRMSDDQYSTQRQGLLTYMCGDWNTKNPDNPITLIRFIESREETNLAGAPEAITQTTYGEQFCD